MISGATLKDLFELKVRRSAHSNGHLLGTHFASNGGPRFLVVFLGDPQKLAKDARIDPPIHARYLRSLDATTSTLFALYTASPFTSLDRRCCIPGNMVLPPDKIMWLYNSSWHDVPGLSDGVDDGFW